MTTTDAPRTRRQLREALGQTQCQLDAATSWLSHLGYHFGEKGYGDQGADIFRIGWHKTEEAEARDRANEAKLIGGHVDEAIAKTRRETLTAVIDALELTSYGYRERGRRYLSGIDRGAESEALWVDIQTTLQVRAEKKAADERAKTEEKVAALRKQPPITLGFDLANGGFIPGYAVREFRPGDGYGYGYAAKVAETRDTVNLNVDGRALLEDIRGASKRDSAGFSPRGEDGMPENVTKKPAKKKSEDKK